MGLIYSEVEVNNPIRGDLAAMTLRVLVDSGAVHFCVPAHVALQLDLHELEKREVTLASGERRMVSYVGPVRIRFGNRHCFTGAMVLGDLPLLGAIPMEDMDLVILPRTQVLAVNPDNPNVPGSVARETPARPYAGRRSGSAQDKIVPVD